MGRACPVRETPSMSASSACPTMSAAARMSASSTASVLLAKLLVEVFATAAREGVCYRLATKKFIASKALSRMQRKELAALAGLEKAWVECDQGVVSNVTDLADALVSELVEPFWFFRTSSLSTSQPRSRFVRQVGTPPLAPKGRDKFWTACSAQTRASWLPKAEATFDAVVHFVQSGSGTGVHVGDGLVLTCAHVIDARDDEQQEFSLPDRVGRQKIVMFPSGRTFIAECAAVSESECGSRDTAVVVLGAELDVSSLPTRQAGDDPRLKRLRSEGSSDPDRDEVEPDSCFVAPSNLPTAEVRSEAVEIGDRLFCVGNPSNVDLESIDHGEIEFEPPTWHTSFGRCEGSKAEGPTTATLQHSCWTYWGHSGAPIFDETGKVSGLHSSWDDGNGMRHAQKLQHLHAVQCAAEQPFHATSKSKRAGVGGRSRVQGGGKKRKK